METDADLDVGEFGIATRMVQPDRRRAAVRASREGDVAPGATMIYKPTAPAATQAVSAGGARRRARSSSRSPSTATRYEVKQRRVVIGRSRDCDIQLADTNVSRRHAELRQEGASYWIVDLGSTNGLEVNGKRVKRAKLSDGDKITVGSTDVIVQPGDRDDLVDSVAVDEVLLVLKIAFLVLLYLFIWRIVRTASRDLRLPQESFVLAPSAGAGRHASRSRGRCTPGGSSS